MSTIHVISTYNRVIQGKLEIISIKSQLGDIQPEVRNLAMDAITAIEKFNNALRATADTISTQQQRYSATQTTFEFNDPKKVLPITEDETWMEKMLELVDRGHYDINNVTSTSIMFVGKKGQPDSGVKVTLSELAPYCWEIYQKWKKAKGAAR